MISHSLRFAAKRLVKRLAIQAGLEAVALSGVDRFASSAAGRGVIFTLHHVRPQRDFAFEPNGHLSITPEFLDSALTAARKAGLEPVPLEQLPELLPDPADRRRLFCVTLDDGYRDNAKYAAPIFRKHGVPYTIFITPGFVERTRTIWWETAEALTRAVNSFRFDFGKGAEIVPSASISEKWMAFERLAAFVQQTDEDAAVAAIDQAALAYGADGRQIVDDEIMTATELRELTENDPLARLGAHTLTHPNLARVDAMRLQRELQQSAIRVSDYCGRSPNTFAYPYGNRHAVGPREASAALDCGYVAAVTTQPGVLRRESAKKPALLPRVSLNGHYQRKRYVRALISGLPFRLT
ncbi:MAG TPA: polysaccharide deacetylase family protein [Bradyrhizobium sp.]|nr:polysaccharide deacetylase family protein [Bradyrhizobium sp.]